MDLIGEKSNAKVHVSGHPSRGELKKMYDMVLPDLLIPIHGEYRHLNEHIEFSKKCGIKNQLLVENGDLVKLNKDCLASSLKACFSVLGNCL